MSGSRDGTIKLWHVATRKELPIPARHNDAVLAVAFGPQGKRFVSGSRDNALKVFDIPSSLTRGGPGRATEVVSLFTYRTALRFFDHGYAAAQGFLLLFIVMFIVTILFGRIRGLYEEGS